MFYLILYFATGVALFFTTRWLYLKARVPLENHRKSWVFVSTTIEGWLLSAIWPVFAAASLIWLCIELYDAKLKRADASAREKEKARDKSLDHLSLAQKIDLLEAEAQKRK